MQTINEIKNMLALAYSMKMRTESNTIEILKRQQRIKTLEWVLQEDKEDVIKPRGYTE